MGVDQSRLLELVRDDAADKVRYGVPECGHEVAQGGLVKLGHGHKLAALLSLGVLALLTLVVGPQPSDEGVCGLAEQFHHGVIQWVLVLVEPALDCVANLERERKREYITA